MKLNNDMNDLSKIERLLEELSEYRTISRTRLGVIQAKICLAKSAIERGQDPTEKNNKLMEKLNVVKDHFHSDCYLNPPLFLKEFTQRVMEAYAPLESLTDNYSNGIKTGNFFDFLERMDESVTDFAVKLSAIQKRNFLTIIYDVLRIYDAKGGSSSELLERVRQSTDSPLQEPHAKMIFDAETKAKEHIQKENEYLERTRALYPEFLK